jgi:predicted RNA binding protein YcfA (HicA-like mRNA interferase family)
MPDKIRVLKKRLKQAGFEMRPGRGSHTVWEHPNYPDVKITMSGQDGKDAERYQQKEVEDAIERVGEKHER